MYIRGDALLLKYAYGINIVVVSLFDAWFAR